MNPKAIFGELISHWAQVPLIVTRAQAVVDAEGLPDQWTAFKGLGDVLVPIAADLVGAAQEVGTLSDADEKEFRAAILSMPNGEVPCGEVEALGLFRRRPPVATDPNAPAPGPRFDGTLMKQLLANLPAIIAAIQALLPMFGGAK